MLGIENLDEIQKRTNDIALHIVKEHSKGKSPLLVIGSGVSMNLKIPSHLEGKVQEMRIPTMVDMIRKLHSFYDSSDKSGIPDQDREGLEKCFEIWNDQQSKQGGKVDRSIVADILVHFQEKLYLKEVWLAFNNWLLDGCVSEAFNIGIIEALPSIAHEKIAKLYEEVDAFCLTTNFDGLCYKALQNQYTLQNEYKGRVDVFSYCESKDAENFFTIENTPRGKKDFAEIQIRGDIFFVKCDSSWCNVYHQCNDSLERPIRIWESRPEPMKCSRGQDRKPFISFPGTYEKDQEVRKILGVLWQYLSYRISCVITIGLGGWWDPILTAFLSDLKTERNIPFFIDVNISPEDSYIAKEIAGPDSSLKISADNFMDILSRCIGNVQKPLQTQITYSREEAGVDRFWDTILQDSRISDFEKRLLQHPLVEITSKFAQLGLKSKWWGIQDRWHHNRRNHSKGVMKIASFLYERACENSDRSEKAKEKQFLRIAALLHDVGHLSFSHLIEEVFQELNWRPGGYIESFSHEYYTEERIQEIFRDEKLEKELHSIGYSVEDMVKLIRGEFGVGFLDAIINGPVDADKIDYVFRDVASTQVFAHSVEPEKFLAELGRQISISPAGLLVVKGSSAQAAFTVLEQREKLYKELYLHPGIRLLEKATKFIIITYFVHTYNTLDIPVNIKEAFLDDQTQISDLGAIRVAMASQELADMVDRFKGEPDIEMKMIRHMKEQILDGKRIDGRVVKAIEECFYLIESVHQKGACENELVKREKGLSISQFLPEQLEKHRYNAKTVTLRFPGAILVDVLPPFQFSKIAGTRKRKIRSDGTNVESECILCPDLLGYVKEHLGKRAERKQGQIRVYKIGEDAEVNRALGLFQRLLTEEKGMEELE